MNQDEYNFEDILDKIECNERILQFRYQYKHTLVWPLIRVDVYRVRLLTELENHCNDYINKKVSVRKRRAQIILSGFKKIFSTPFLWKQKDILYLYNAVGNVIIDDHVINRTYDDFLLEFNNQSGAIETLGNKKYKSEKYIDKRYFDSIYLFIEVLSYFTKDNPEDVKMANDLIDYLSNECRMNILPSHAERIKKIILNIPKKIKYMDVILPRMFRAIKPKLVFIECAHYGDSTAYLNKILHEMGIKTAEAQHGIVGNYHEAYFHSDFLCNNAEYAKYMTDYFLGYGEYWIDKINIPGEKIAIGNPWFWRQYTRFLNENYNNQSASGNKKTVLWIPFEDHGMDLEILEGFIRESNNEYSIRVRLHPIYNYFKSDYKKYEDDGKIIMDELPTIYDSFAISDCVVSESSTVIYEALAVGKPTFILESEFSIRYQTLSLAPNFRNASELLNLIRSTQETMYIDPDIRIKFFGEQWQDKFKHFINRVLAES